MKILRILFFILLTANLGIVNGQVDSAVPESDTSIHSKYKVGLFVPLHLDSAFDNMLNYRHGKTFPRQSIGGLEFYEGAEMALDSISKERNDVELHVFDTRSSTGAISTVANTPLIDSLDLIIGHVSGTEYLQLSDLARIKNIPFVSATYPNDGGIKNNPNVIIVNSKLNTHIQSLYNFVLRNWGTYNIVWFRSKNSADDRIENVFKELNQSPGGGVIKYKTFVLPDFFSVSDIAPKLEKDRQNIIIAGSLSENFAIRMATACLGLDKSYPVNLVGMPTWEGIKDLGKSDFNPLPVYFSSTFYLPHTSEGWSSSFEESFRRKTFSKPSDLAYKGYEITHYFVRLLLKYDSTLISHLDDKSFKLLTEFDFKPIRWSKTSTVPDYYENKRVYIVRRLNGILERQN